MRKRVKGGGSCWVKLVVEAVKEESPGTRLWYSVTQANNDAWTVAGEERCAEN